MLQKFTLPLLLKELIEQSARRRTYIIRVLYVSLFFLACLCVILPEVTSRGSSPLSVLGVGRNIFIAIIGWQFAGIYLFLPALACSVLTVEKERNTIGLLFLTRLGPWTIVLEKLLSRLIPMYYLIFCSLPLLAFSITLGGVNVPDMFVAVWFLALTAFQICSIAVACSAFFRTTTAALLTCYVVMFVVMFGLPITDWLIFDNELRDIINGVLRYWYGAQAINSPFFSILGEVVLFSGIGFVQFIIRMEQRVTIGADWALLAVTTMPLLLSAVLPIPIARFFLIRRAFIAPRNLVLISLRWVDGVFHELNNNPLTKGRIVLDESRKEPDFSPIAWRETYKRSLGQTVYLVRIFLALEIPVLVVILSLVFRATSSGGGNMDTILNLTTVLVWVAVVLLVSVTSAGLISGERGRQTLDTLLTMPITGRQIIVDKIAGVRRIMFVAGIPLVTCIVFESWWRDVIGTYSYYPSQRHYIWWNYLLTSLAMVFTYLPLLCWLPLWIGLKTKSPTRATLTTLTVIVAWCAVPYILALSWWAIFTATYRPFQPEDYFVLLQMSPLALVYQSEFESLASFSEVPLLPMFIHIFFYGTCWFVIKHWILTHADKLLGRSQSPLGPLNSPVRFRATQQLAEAPSLAD